MLLRGDSYAPATSTSKDTNLRHAKRDVFLHTSEEISTPQGLLCGYCLASSLASPSTRRVAQEKVGPRSDSLGRQLMWLAG